VDLAVFKAEWDTFHDKLDNCATKCLGAQQCATACIKKDLKLTDACADCFGIDVHCTAMHCMVQCMKSHKSEECLNCHKVQCMPDLLKCAQVDESLIPK